MWGGSLSGVGITESNKGASLYTQIHISAWPGRGVYLTLLRTLGIGLATAHPIQQMLVASSELSAQEATIQCSGFIGLSL